MERPPTVEVYENIFGFRGDLCTVIGLERVDPAHVAYQQGQPVGIKHRGRVIPWSYYHPDKYTIVPGWR